MEWTDIQITVPQQYAETAEAIATMVSNCLLYTSPSPRDRG